MVTRVYTELSNKEDELGASSRDEAAVSSAPPLAPTGPHAHSDAEVAPTYALDPVKSYEQPSQLLPKGDTRLGLRQTLMAGTAIVATLGVCAFTFFFWPSVDEKTATQTAHPGAAIQSSTQTAREADQVLPSAPPLKEGSGTPKQAPLPSAAAASPTPSVKNPADGVRTSATSPENVGSREAVPQNRDVLFSQPSGANIRSTPSANGTIVGTAPKGTRFEVTNRQGNWVAVENGRWKGWINSRLLAPNEPR